MEETKQPARLERIEKMIEDMQQGKKKVKKFKVPAKGKVSNRRMRAGYATIVIIEDNKNIDFAKEQIIDGTIKLDDTFHAIDSHDVFFYKNKPFIFIPKRALNPYNPLKVEHQTYGQKYVMARMEGDKIITKKKMGMGLAIGILIIIGIVIYAVMGG